MRLVVIPDKGSLNIKGEHVYFRSDGKELILISRLNREKAYKDLQLAASHQKNILLLDGVTDPDGGPITFYDYYICSF